MLKIKNKKTGEIKKIHGNKKKGEDNERNWSDNKKKTKWLKGGKILEKKGKK